MNTTSNISLEQTKRPISSGLLGMIFLLATEAMLFAGFISSFIVNKSATTIWPPIGQPRLPIVVTLISTLILIASGIIYTFFARKYKASVGNTSTQIYLIVSALLGAAFVSIQGYEWIQLLSFGLTSRANLYGAYFYMIIGIHALHVAVGLALLLYLLFFVNSDASVERIKDRIVFTGAYWYFVVAIWPILYYLVYLS